MAKSEFDDEQIMESERSNQSKEQAIIDQMAGECEIDDLLNDYGGGSPVISYLSSGEKLEYILHHMEKGVRITDSNGNSITPYNSVSDGDRYLLITDKRILFLARNIERTLEISVPFRHITEVESKNGWIRKRISFYLEDGRKISFWDAGKYAKQINPAAHYIEGRIGSKSPKDSPELSEIPDPADYEDPLRRPNLPSADPSCPKVVPDDDTYAQVKSMWNGKHPFEFLDEQESVFCLLAAYPKLEIRETEGAKVDYSDERITDRFLIVTQYQIICVTSTEENTYNFSIPYGWITQIDHQQRADYAGLLFSLRDGRKINFYVELEDSVDVVEYIRAQLDELLLLQTLARENDRYRTANTRINEGNYRSGVKLYRKSLYNLMDMNEIAIPAAGNLRQEVESKIEDAFEEIDAKLSSDFLTAKVKEDNGEHDHAIDDLYEVLWMVNIHQELTNDFNINSALSLDESEVREMLSRVKRKKKSEKRKKEAERRRKKAERISTNIANQLDVEEPSINSNDDNDVLSAYEDINSAITSIKEVRDEIENEIYNQFIEDLTKFVTSGKAPSPDSTSQYREIAEDAKKILAFLADNPSHPSVDNEDWRNSVTIAIENRYPSALTPISKQIDRMGDALWKREHLHQFTWSEFEELIGSLYESQGHEVEVTQKTVDMGVDVWTKKEGVRYAIQVKQNASGNTVGRTAIQRLVSTLAKDDADRAVMVTSGEFANTAEQYSDDFGPEIQLIDGNDLIRLLSESKIPPPV